MDLWIRSQDKKELRANPKLGLDKLKDEYYIVDRYDFERAIILGVYKTEQRALEVLDEIQKLDIENNLNIETVCYAFNLLKVTYNMPEK